MSAQSWESVISGYVTGSGAAYNTSVALTDVSPAPQLVVPANWLQPGQIYKITAAGTFSNTGTPTLLLGTYIGGVAGAAIAASGAITTITGATNWSWQVEQWFQVRAVGTSGTIMPLAGRLRMPASLTTAQAEVFLPATAPATVTVDTTAAKALTLGAQWGTSSASNTLTCLGFVVEQMN